MRSYHIKQIKMGRKSQISTIEEEALAECVRKYTCLYDKSCAEYKSKTCVRNAWAAINRELGFEEGKELVYYY